MDNSQRSARLEARVAPEVHALLKRAADLEGRTLTDFVVSASLEAARRTLEQTEIIRLSGENAEFVAKLLAEPPEMTPAMKRAHERHKRLVVSK